MGASIALAEEIAQLSRMLRFFVAPIARDRRTRRRVEAALADAISAAPGEIGAFQDKGVRYERRRDGEAPIEVRVAGAGATAMLGLPAIVVA